MFRLTNKHSKVAQHGGSIAELSLIAVGFDARPNYRVSTTLLHLTFAHVGLSLAANTWGCSLAFHSLMIRYSPPLGQWLWRIEKVAAACSSRALRLGAAMRGCVTLPSQILWRCSMRLCAAVQRLDHGACLYARKRRLLCLYPFFDGAQRATATFTTGRTKEAIQSQPRTFARTRQALRLTTRRERTCYRYSTSKAMSLPACKRFG
eukprot:6186532-Pleurochrysis_carterae.AAC.2